MSIDSTVKHSLKFNVGFLKTLLAGIEEDQMTHQPCPGMNHPAWIVGHLVVTMAGAAKIAGAGYVPPEGWPALFGKQSTPVGEAGAYPAKQTLLDELDKSIEALMPVMDQLDADALAAENPIEGFRERMPTVGDALTFIFNSHLGLHCGQLSAWRRAIGLPPLF